MLAKILVHQEELYPDFISESARLLVDAFGHDAEDPKNLIGDPRNLISVYAFGWATILTAGQEVVNTIINAYREPNQTPQQIRSMP